MGKVFRMSLRARRSPNEKVASGVKTRQGQRVLRDRPKQTKDVKKDRKTSRPSASASRSKYREARIHVGIEYQATLPDFTSAQKSKSKRDEHLATLLWKPRDGLKADKIEAYVSLAKREYGYNEEQALGLLTYHNYDLRKTKSDLVNLVPFPDKFTEEEKALFNSQIVSNGIDLQRISKLFPRKRYSSIVVQFYRWKIENEQKITSSRPDSSDVQQSSSVSFQSQPLLSSPSTSKSKKIPACGSQKRCGKCKVHCKDGSMTFNMCQVCYIDSLKTGKMRTNSSAEAMGESKVGPKKKAEAATAKPKGKVLKPDAVKPVEKAKYSTGKGLLPGLVKQIRDKKDSIQNAKQKVGEASRYSSKNRVTSLCRKKS